MADFYAGNAQLAVDGKKARPGDINGHVKNHYDEITFGQAVIAAGDVIHLGKLPKGSKVKSLHLNLNNTLGTGGTFKVGYAVTNADATDRTSNILVATDIKAGGLFAYNMFNDPLLEEKEIIATCTVATTAATGVKMQVGVGFVAD